MKDLIVRGGDVSWRGREAAMGSQLLIPNVFIKAFGEEVISTRENKLMCWYWDVHGTFLI